MTAAIPPEFSRPISTLRLGSEPARYEVAATAAERAALADRFGIPAIHVLEAEIGLQRRPEGDIAFAATMRAAVTQICVVTLEPFDVSVEEPFTLVFRPGIDEDEADRLALEEPDEETVEPLVNDQIDIGEVVAQELALALDPYPRGPGAAAADGGEGQSAGQDTVTERSESPFAVLRRPPKS
jgi:uncharacterized metal-binding protein YceD (DUF177 family)